MTKTARLRAALLEVLAEHQADGTLPTSGRFLFYELEQRGIVSKVPTGKRRPDQDLTEALTSLREDGIVPWEWIIDETRTLSDPIVASTVADWVTLVLDQARVDPWRGWPPLVLCESRSLAGVLRGIADRYSVPLASTNGQCAGFLHTNVAPIMEPGQIALYLGDLDLSGHDIERNNRRVIEGDVGALAWERLAITSEQVEHYGLAPIVKNDRRRKDGGHHLAVETEALGQALIVSLVTDRLDELLPEPLDDVLERTASQRAEMAARLGR